MNIEEQKAKPKLIRLKYINLHPIHVCLFVFSSSTGDEKEEAVNLNPNFLTIGHFSTVQNGAC